MKIISVAAFADMPKNMLLGKTAIMIDALRASATIVTAIAHGCDRIVPANEANEAADIRRISEGNVLLCGEIGGEKVSGFDLGNSPLEYTQDVVGDRILVYSTTNGSVAVKAMSDAENVLIGTFINATAVAEKAYALGNEIVLVCAGTHRKFSTDDTVAMGCIIDRLLDLDEGLETDDLGKVALKLYMDYRVDIMKGLEGSSHYEQLKEMKLLDDLEYCTREDLFEVVPVYQEGVIVK